MTTEPTTDLPFTTLLYRFFFFGWLFRPIPADDKLQRGLAVQHNRRQARWLPTYMFRWAWLGFFFYALGEGTEIFFAFEGVARSFYAASAMSLSFIVTMATAWVHLAHATEKR